MVAYVVNEQVTDMELELLTSASNGIIEIRKWPTINAVLPGDISLAILIIRSTGTETEEKRILRSVASSIRLVCIYLEDIPNPADIVIKYCSAKCSITGTGFADALAGDDSVQVDHKNEPLPKNKQKHHNC